MAVASNPSLLMAFAASSHLLALRLEITTFAPARASARAMASPIPLVEPVTIATLPVRSNSDCDIYEPLKVRSPAFFRRKFVNRSLLPSNQLLLRDAFHNKCNRDLRSSLRLELRHKDDVAAFLLDLRGRCAFRLNEADHTRVIRARRFRAHLHQLFKLWLSLRVLIHRDRHQHQKVANRRYAQVIAISRVHRVSQRVGPRLHRLSSIVGRRSREGDHSYKGRLTEIVNRALSVALAHSHSASQPDIAIRTVTDC